MVGIIISSLFQRRKLRNRIKNRNEEDQQILCSKPVSEPSNVPNFPVPAPGYQLQVSRIREIFNFINIYLPQYRQGFVSIEHKNRPLVICINILKKLCHLSQYFYKQELWKIILKYQIHMNMACNSYNSVAKKGNNPILKRQKSEQKLFQRGETDDQQAHEEMLNIH